MRGGNPSCTRGFNPGVQTQGDPVSDSFAPRGHWHACVHWVPIIDGKYLEPGHRACSFEDENDSLDRLRPGFWQLCHGVRHPRRKHLFLRWLSEPWTRLVKIYRRCVFTTWIKATALGQSLQDCRFTSRYSVAIPLPSPGRRLCSAAICCVARYLN
jgi:hypothetical protein